MTIETFENRHAAEDAERLAIADERPRHNIVGAANDNRKAERVVRSAKALQKPKDDAPNPQQVYGAVMSIMFDEMAGQVHLGRTWSDIVRRMEHWRDRWKQDEGTRFPTPDEIASAISLLAIAGDILMDGDRVFLPLVGDYRFHPSGGTGKFFPVDVSPLPTLTRRSLSA